MSISALSGAAGAPQAHRAHHHAGVKSTDTDNDQATNVKTAPTAADPDGDGDTDGGVARLSPQTSSSSAVQSALAALKLGGE